MTAQERIDWMNQQLSMKPTPEKQVTGAPNSEKEKPKADSEKGKA